MGSIPEIATGYAGNSTVVPDYAQPVAEILRLNGYNTGAFGKWHETLGGKRLLPDHRLVGQRAKDLRSSTASWAQKTTCGIPLSMMESPW